MKQINAISIRGNSFDTVGEKVSAVIEATGQKPDYIVVDKEQHDSMLVMDGNIKIKQGRVLKYKGLSVVVTL